jgi:hypothetical protein
MSSHTLCLLQAQQRDLSFCVFARTSPVRKLAILIVENPWFNRLVLAIIMANCVFLAIANPQCDTEVEIANKPECAGDPKWQRVRRFLLSDRKEQENHLPSGNHDRSSDCQLQWQHGLCPGCQTDSVQQAMTISRLCFCVLASVSGNGCACCPWRLLHRIMDRQIVFLWAGSRPLAVPMQ